MYANLKVSVANHGAFLTEDLFAYKVRVDGNVCVVEMDGNDGERDAVHVGTRRFDTRTHDITISTDF